MLKALLEAAKVCVTLPFECSTSVYFALASIFQSRSAVYFLSATFYHVHNNPYEVTNPTTIPRGLRMRVIPLRMGR